MKPTHYELLQVSRIADTEVIDAAWKVLMRRYHPDGSAPDEEMARAVNHAHDILTDPQKRRLYDGALDQSAANAQAQTWPHGFGASNGFGGYANTYSGDGEAYAAAQGYGGAFDPFAQTEPAGHPAAIDFLVNTALQLSGAAFHNFLKTLPPGVSAMVAEYLRRQGKKVA